MACTRREFIIGSGCFLLAAGLPARAQQGVVLSGRAFGGAWKVALAGEARAQALASEINSGLKEIERAMSPFRPDSEISRFNSAVDTNWIRTGNAFSAVTAEALRIAALSGGAFDPSIGPDVARYGFGPILGKRVGTYEGFATQIDAIRKNDTRLSLDLCGIAKGYALDIVAARLRANGITNFMIEIGGEIMSQGRSIDGAPWRLGIANPVTGDIYCRVTGDGLAFATSGDAVNAYEIGGRRYSHIIDPKTGQPVGNAVASVTVAATKGMTADALATALYVLGPDRGLDLARRIDLPAFYLVRTAEGLVERSNPQFEALRPN